MADAPPVARILVAAGARSAESVLLDAVALHVEAALRDVTRLARPVRIVVPSWSLRGHVSAALVRRFGALAGVQVQTLRGLAREVLERAGAPARAGEGMVPILVRAMARREGVLSEKLAGLRDGYGALVGPVRDLLDAGLTGAQLEAVLEAAAALPVSSEERERVAGLVRVAVRVTTLLDGLGIDAHGALLQRARAAVERDADAVLPQRALFVHGFADATGLATDLLLALLRHGGACMVLDRPPDPADPARPDPGEAFLARFVGRLSGVATPEEAGAAADPPVLALRKAPGLDAEVRSVAGDIRALLDGGRRPESIGVVARVLSPFRAALRRHLLALGIPFSITRAGEGRDGVGRRFRALLDLLERGEEATTDRWLDALAVLPAAGASELELRLALHVLGAARLVHVAALEPSLLGVRVRLPVARAPGAQDADAATLPRREVAAAAVLALAERARTAQTELEAWPSTLRVSELLPRVRRLAEGALGWRDDPALLEIFEARMRALQDELPGEPELDREEQILLLQGAFGEIGAAPPGGSGAGVAVLDAVEARGRTFEHLFVVGLNRDVFPRIVLEDPLFPDAARAGLVDGGRGVLPDLPQKLGGYDEERYLFAQLAASAPHVTLSWQVLDDEGRERAPSTLVERLRLARPELPVTQVPTPWSVRESHGIRPPSEHAVRAALHDGRDVFERILPWALEEALEDAAHLACRDGAAFDGPDAASLARARMAALAGLDPRGAARNTLGPGLGLVGPRRSGDGKGRIPSVTLLENIAGCPWRAYLTRVVRVEPLPDALDVLPDLDALLVGSALHRVVERIVKDGLGDAPRSLGEARARGARPVRWPSGNALAALAREVAEGLLREESRYFPGLAGALVERIWPLLAEVKAQLWEPSGGAPALLGAELEAVVGVPDAGGRRREIAFRADLVSEEAGRIVLTDLKTGKAISTGAKEETRRKHLLQAMARGSSLQAAAYARAGDEGRYAFVDAEKSEGFALASVRADDAEAAAVFDGVLGTLFSIWDEGAFFPRLALPGDMTGRLPCEFCEVREACAYGDTGARQRLVRFGSPEGETEGEPAILAAARRGFRLPAEGTGDGEEAE